MAWQPGGSKVWCARCKPRHKIADVWTHAKHAPADETAKLLAAAPEMLRMLSSIMRGQVHPTTRQKIFDVIGSLHTPDSYEIKLGK